MNIILTVTKYIEYLVFDRHRVVCLQDLAHLIFMVSLDQWLL